MTFSCKINRVFEKFLEYDLLLHFEHEIVNIVLSTSSNSLNVFFC